MKTSSRFAVPAVAATAIVALATGACGPTSSAPSATPGTATPSVSPRSAAPVTAPSSTPAAPPTALTETFTSERYGFTVSHPADWVARPATEAWTSGIPDFSTASGDVLYHEAIQEDLWIMVASRAHRGTSGDEWVDDTLAELTSADFCDAPIADVTIADVPGKQCASGAVAMSVGERGYVVLPYVSGDDPTVGDTYDQAWFQEVMGTLAFTPDAARDLASSPPSS
jgi:hypothetical protein